MKRNCEEAGAGEEGRECIEVARVPTDEML